jgi:hypothetical protein
MLESAEHVLDAQGAGERLMRLLMTTALAVAIPVSGGPVASATDGPHPDAPAETSQFAFLIGTWDCTTRFMKPDGSGFNEGEGTWTGYWILGGWAIQDDWKSPRPDGGFNWGTNIRSFNPRTRKWDNRWLATGSLQWLYYEAEKKGETMVMIGGRGRDGAGRDYVDRNVFHEIGPDSWKWRKDRSFDGGQTWFEGVGFIEARRAGSGAS